MIAETVPVPENAVSATDMLFRVTLPVLVTRNEYDTLSPALFTVVGVADFTASAGSCVAGQSVSFTDLSSVPGASGWHWDFGDGGVSDVRNPVHVYESPGTFDVRLTVTGSAGAAVRQKASEIAVAPAARTIPPIPEPPAGTRTLDPR